MDVIKVAKTPGTVGPVIRDPHNPKWPTIIKGGWEDVRWGGGQGAILDPTWVISQEDWFGGSGVITDDPADPGLFGPSIIKHLEGWRDRTSEDIIGGDGEGGKKPVTGDIKPGLIHDGSTWVISDGTGFGIEGDYGFSADWGFSGGDSGYITDEDTTGLIDDSDRKGIITDGDKDTWGITGGWDARGDTNIPKHEVPKRGDDQYDAATEYGGIILKVDGSTWFGGTNEGITKTGSRIPVLWKDIKYRKAGTKEWLGPIFWKADPWLSGEGLLIGGVEESIDHEWYIDGGSDYVDSGSCFIGGTESLIDADDWMGHTCPFVSPGFDDHTNTFGEKDFGVQPRT